MPRKTSQVEPDAPEDKDKENLPVPQETMDEDPAIEITYEDLSTIVNIIDVVTERGAFKGGEISSVGALRDKLISFIQNNS